MVITGIDPGLNGGLCTISGGAGMKPKIIRCTDVPTTGVNKRRRVDIHAVIAFLQRCPPDVAFIEVATLMPGQDVGAGARFMRAVGYLECCVIGLDIKLEPVAAASWKRAHGLIKCDKEASRRRAMALFPDSDKFVRAKDHNRAESALIAWYGYQILRARRAANAA